MAPSAVLAATALLATLSFTTAHEFSYDRSLYARHHSEGSIDPLITARAMQKVLARRGLDDEDELYTRDDMTIREADAEAESDPLFEHDDILFNYRRSIDSREADADAEPDPLFEHDDILFNYKREADGGDSFFDDLEFFDILARDIDTREAEADADADADAHPDPLFEHDDILFNYKREAVPEGADSFFDDLEFFDVVARDEMSTRDAEAHPDPLFEHDDILFNYKRSIDIREAIPSPSADADADADAHPDPLFEHDDILFNYRRSLDDPFDELEFTDLITRSTDPFEDVEFTDLLTRSTEDPFDEIEFTDLVARSAERQAEGSFTPWYQNSVAQARKGDYKSPGQAKADAQRAGGLLAGTNSGDAGSGYSGAVAGGVAGNAFNEALDASSAGASSMDAAAMDAGGLGI